VTLYEIDQDATRRRIEAITTNGLRALTDLRQRSEDIDKAADEMFERQEREKQELDERVRLAAGAEKVDESQEADTRPEPKRTLSLGGDEFQQNREARQAETASATPPPPPATEPDQPRPQDEVRPSQTFRLGARDEQDDAPKQDKPARKRPPRPEADDDMSGRTWLR
jgi:hypothetical protein